MKTQAIAIILASAAVLTASAEQYRLKIAASVDVLEDGKVIGQKRLKPGTVVEIVNTKESANDQKKANVSSGSLQLSKLSPIVFKNTQPATPHVFNAEVELYSLYLSPFDENEKDYWNVSIWAFNSKWQGREQFYGYVKKSDAIGKRVLSLLEDGTEKTVRLKVSIVDGQSNKDLVLIEDIEPTVRPE